MTLNKSTSTLWELTCFGVWGSPSEKRVLAQLLLAFFSATYLGGIGRSGERPKARLNRRGEITSRKKAMVYSTKTFNSDKA